MRLRPLLLAAAVAWLPGCRGESRPAPGPAPAGEDGVTLAYEREVAGNRDIDTIESGGLERRLTEDAAEDILPRWSRDGQRILFASQRSGNWQLWEMAADGSSPRRVRTNQHTEWQVDEAPDGKHLAFLSNLLGSEQLWISNRAGADARVLVRHGADSILGNPDWSPDGRQIVFSSNWKLGHHAYIVDLATGEERRLGSLRRGGCEPRFHPDGQRIVYVSRGHLTGSTSRLVEIDLASGSETVLVDWPALNYGPTYSPDGTELAFASNITGEYQIYRRRLADGQTWRITFGPGSARAPDYRPRR